MYPVYVAMEVRTVGHPQWTIHLDHRVRVFATIYVYVLSAYISKYMEAMITMCEYKPMQKEATDCLPESRCSITTYASLFKKSPQRVQSYLGLDGVLEGFRRTACRSNACADMSSVMQEQKSQRRFGKSVSRGLVE